MPGGERAAGECRPRIRNPGCGAGRVRYGERVAAVRAPASPGLAPPAVEAEYVRRRKRRSTALSNWMTATPSGEWNSTTAWTRPQGHTRTSPVPGRRVQPGLQQGAGEGPLVVGALGGQLGGEDDPDGQGFGGGEPQGDRDRAVEGVVADHAGADALLDGSGGGWWILGGG